MEPRWQPQAPGMGRSPGPPGVNRGRGGSPTILVFPCQSRITAVTFRLHCHLCLPSPFRPPGARWFFLPTGGKPTGRVSLWSSPVTSPPVVCSGPLVPAGPWGLSLWDEHLTFSSLHPGTGDSAQFCAVHVAPYKCLSYASSFLVLVGAHEPEGWPWLPGRSPAHSQDESVLTS